MLKPSYRPEPFNAIVKLFRKINITDILNEDSKLNELLNDVQKARWENFSRNSSCKVRLQTPGRITKSAEVHQFKILDNSSAGILADSVHGSLNRILAAMVMAPFWRRMRFSGKEVLLPLVMEQAVGMLSWRLNMRES